ncbi:assimilatory sulfite reductase (NADPH) flavoprotein subunit [bacterium]|nr:assimilatory sulfite reductase (NADPH) flavoprotein subunit [bacterium]
MTNIVPHIPDHAPFTPEQRAWLNGFLAGLFSRNQLELNAAAAPATQLAPLTILFGSQTGNAESLAKTLSKQASKQGFAPTVYDMGDYPFDNIKHENRIIIITSTYGDGDPPDNAQAFWNKLSTDDALSLAHIEYSVLALGDTNYEKFCQFGKTLDARLEQLGAKRAYQRTDCDVDYDELYEEWANGALPALLPKDSPQVKAPINGSATQPVKEEGYSKKNPFPATVQRVVGLNGDGSEKDTRHVEISLAGSGISYKVGDALGVWPQNCANEVDALINVLGFDPNIEVDVPKFGRETLRKALIEHFDISKVTRPFLKWLLEKTGAEQLEALLQPENKAQLDDYLWGREILDVLNEIPNLDVTPHEFIESLKTIQPRLYSISSSPNAHPDEVHITVGVVQYDSHGREHHGVCSGFLARLVQEGSIVPVFISSSKNFGLPENANVPIIMVGPGTGIAPFRAFLEERRCQGGDGKQWLFFGNPHEATDFLYRDEILSMKEDGILTKFDAAFSRDQQEKIYVQHRMIEQAHDLFRWLEEGAYFYVCGDAQRMAKDVHDALIEIVKIAGGASEDEAADYVQRLQAEKRYQRDVY